MSSILAVFPYSLSTSPHGGLSANLLKFLIQKNRSFFANNFTNTFSFHPGNDPVSVNFDPPALDDGSRINLPVLVMAGNRPQYLFRMLKTLRGVQGLIPSMATVFIDGFFDEPASVARMFGLRVDQHDGVSKKNARISQV